MSDNIPSAIWREIFLRLPAEPVFRLRDVCTSWRHVIDDPSFVKSHTNKHQPSPSTTLLIRNSTGPPFYPLYSFNLETLNLTNGPQTITVTPLKLTPSRLSRLPDLPVAACNGLLLIPPKIIKKNPVGENLWDRTGSFEIWNPLTNESRNVAHPNIDPGLEVVGYGIGHDFVSDDYKIVVIDYVCRRRDSVMQIHVYSLKSDSWREDIKKCPFDPPCRDNRTGVFLDGALHWGTMHGIIVLDLATEQYRKMELPPRETVLGCMHVDALDGRLFLSNFDDYNNRNLFEMWVMNEYGSKDSWVKLLSLCGKYLSYLGRFLRPVAYVERNKQVLMQHCSGFYLVDLESNSKRLFSIHGICENYGIHAQMCGGSLFRLRDSCGSVGSERKTRKRKRRGVADTKLTFCVRDYDAYGRSPEPSHDDCYFLDSNCYNSCSEGSDE